MIAISTTELRKNLKKYLNLATSEKVVVRFNKSETVEIVPGKKVRVRDEFFDNTRLLEVLKRGEEDVAAGRFTEIKEKNLLELSEHPTIGTGKAERLRGDLSGYFSSNRAGSFPSRSLWCFIASRWPPGNHLIPALFDDGAKLIRNCIPVEQIDPKWEFRLLKSLFQLGKNAPVETVSSHWSIVIEVAVYCFSSLQCRAWKTGRVNRRRDQLHPIALACLPLPRMFEQSYHPSQLIWQQ